MTMKDQKHVLKSIFKVGVDGNNANAYYIIKEYMKDLPVEAKKLTFTLPALKSVLEELSKDWDKEIDKII